jgi:hypothetical protein
MRRILIALTVLLALGMIATTAMAAIQSTINFDNAPSGTHLQAGMISCSVVGLTVTCTRYELAGVGNTNADLLLTASYSGTVDCFNPGGNLVESHETTFSATVPVTLTPSKNGRLVVPAESVSPSLDLAEPCPNPNWTPQFHEGSPTLDSFTYTLTFTGITGAVVTITGP